MTALECADFRYAMFKLASRGLFRRSLQPQIFHYFEDHSTTRAECGHWGGIRQVIFDCIKRMYGMLPALFHREVRRAVGLRVTRKVTKMGIEAFRMPYQGNEEFRRWVLRNIGASLTICVDPNRKPGASSDMAPPYDSRTVRSSA